MVGVEQEVGQVEELWDQLSDVPRVVSGGRLPLLLYAVKHPLWDIKPSLWGDEAQRCQTRGTVEPNFATGVINKVVCLIQWSEPYFISFIVLCKQEIFTTI